MSARAPMNRDDKLFNPPSTGSSSGSASYGSIPGQQDEHHVDCGLTPGKHHASLQTTTKTKGLKNRFASAASSVMSSVISDLRSDETEDIHAKAHDAEVYYTNSTLQKAFPERFLALMVTLGIEIPVALLVTNNAGVCRLLGTQKYTLLMAFLPVTSAISGNVGLQCSSLTTRAISHWQVTPDTYCKWFSSELWVSVFLALGVSLVVGTVAGVWVKAVSGTFDVGFALAIGLAQIVSIITAGITGTVGPLIFSFVFKRDAGKWAGPLETAVQDIAGALAMTQLATVILQESVRLGLTPYADASCDA